MSVIIRPITTTGGGAPLLAGFSDTFVRASGALGTQWVQASHSVTNPPPTEWQDANIGASLTDGSQCLRWLPVGAGNPTCVLSGFAFPLPNYQAIRNRNAFVQCTLVGAAGAALERYNSGIAVQIRGDENTAYCLEALPQINVLQLLRINQSTITLISGVGGGVANGDILRLSFTVSAGQVDFIVKKNGVTVGTFTDNSASRLTVGTTGFWVRGGGGGVPTNGYSEWRNFSTGLGA